MAYWQNAWPRQIILNLVRRCLLQIKSEIGHVCWILYGLPLLSVVYLLVSVTCMFVNMANLATKPSSRDGGLVARLAILTNMLHKPGGSQFEAGSC